MHIIVRVFCIALVTKLHKGVARLLIGGGGSLSDRRSRVQFDISEARKRCRGRIRERRRKSTKKARVRGKIASRGRSARFDYGEQGEGQRNYLRVGTRM